MTGRAAPSRRRDDVPSRLGELETMQREPGKQRDVETHRGHAGGPASERWRASGVVALTTDFGLVDPYVGSMKGVILSGAPRATLVDVTHGVPPQDVRVGAFFLEHARRAFGVGTVHVAVVDPGVGSERALLVALDRGQCFLAPDNGLLTYALSDRARVWRLDAARFARPGASRTFHGRDVLAPAAAAIVAGLEPEHAGTSVRDDWVRLVTPARTRTHDSITAAVLFADHYGNLVLDVEAAELGAPHEAWHARIGSRVVPFRGTYALARPGEALLLVDSYGAMELAVRDGDARATLKLAPGDRVTLERVNPEHLNPGRRPEHGNSP